MIFTMPVPPSDNREISPRPLVYLLGVQASAMLIQQSARDRDNSGTDAGGKQRCRALAPPQSRFSVSVEPRCTSPFDFGNVRKGRACLAVLFTIIPHTERAAINAHAFAEIYLCTCADHTAPFIKIESAAFLQN